jgi:exocyst complex component 8
MLTTLIQTPVRVLDSSTLLSKLSDILDLKLKLANSTEAELRSLQSSLQNSKEDVAADLQRNVLKKFVYYDLPVARNSDVLLATPSLLLSQRKLGRWRTR